MYPIPPEQVALVRALRAELRAKQKPHHCPKHPDAPSRLFDIYEPGRKVKARFLCIECASVLVHVHHATLKGRES